MTALAIYFFVLGRGDNWEQLWYRDYIDNATYCPPPASNGTNGSASSFLINEGIVSQVETFTWMDFLRRTWIWIVVTIIGAIVAGIIFLELFSACAVFMVYGTISLAIIIPAAAGVVLIVVPYFGGTTDITIGAILIALAFVLLVVMCFFKSYLDRVGKLLDAAADGVKYNWELIFFVIILQICMIIYLAILAIFGIAALTNGRFKPNPDREGSEDCVNVDLELVPCCVWEKDRYVTIYWVFIALLMVWNIFLFFELRVYVVSSVIAEWYFKPEDADNPEGSSRLALRHALGPSFGSLCFGSMFLTMINILRFLIEKLRREDPKNWFMKCISWCAQCILTLLAYITEFATVRMSITGEGFVTAGKEVVEMLTRNSLSTITVWYLPPLVLGASATIISLAVGGIIGGSAYVVWNHEEKEKALSHSILLGVIAVLVVLLVLVFFLILLLNAVNAIFVCFAIDRDNDKESRSKIHDCFKTLPHMGHLTAAGDSGAVESKV